VKKLIRASIILTLTILSTLVVSCGEKGTSPLEAAKMKAAQEGKDILLKFTGSDWCPWCKRLDSEVFGTELFKQEVTKNFVILVLDFPQDKSLLSQKAYRWNIKLYKEYGVPGLPTVILADADGREYARTGYRQGGPKEYLEHLQQLRKLKL